MKILFVAFNLDTLGGIQRYNRKFIKALKEEGCEVSLVELKSTNFFDKILFSISFFLKSLVYAPDFVICTNINFSPLVLLVHKLFHREYGITIYGIEVQNIQNKIFLEALKKSKFIFKLFSEAEKNVLKQIPETEGKFVLIPNSVEEDIFKIKLPNQEFTKTLGVEGKKIILTVCRMSVLDGENKGYMDVLYSLPRVLEKLPGAVYLLVGGGDDVSNVEKDIVKLGLGDKVKILQNIKDNQMPDLYNIADVFILPSKNEGFPPIVLLEAAACGAPNIGGKQPDSAGTIFDGEIGEVVQPGNREEIAEVMIRALKNDKTSERSEFIRSRTIEEYGWNSYKRHIARFLERAER